MWCIILTCFLTLIFSLCFTRRWRHKTFLRKNSRTIRTTVVLGSGGHTMEMLSLISNLGSEFSPRSYVIADSDFLSMSKVKQVEKGGEFSVCLIPRSRQVKQSYATSILSTLRSFGLCFPVLLHQRPQLLLCNGPGTCVPVCFCAFLLDLLCFRTCYIIYVESICRVKTLSLSAKILYHLRLADCLVVQWPELLEYYPKALYLGRL
ncbi:unnamed protein product [Soboliphyme baturini]|uniref:UDP-N-acetylglucosamine transferase subunit ALG14 n=1 Tax=Soboliphyme baturini TaxID=241478 RepID=A0A183ITJ6_9BILA|nr:unnamed protein product [Soboliphyme baturini]